MRSIIALTTAMALTLASPFAMAEAQKPVKKTTTVKKEVKTQQIHLYAQPDNKAKVLENLSLDQRLVPFYHQKNWVKVGVSKDGKVGWINLKQYNQAKQAQQESNMQMILVQTSQSDNGKPTTHIIAYRNGKQLSQEQAKQLYDKLSQQQQRINQQLSHFQNNMNAWFNEDMAQMNQAFGSMQMPVIQPIIVIEKNSDSGKDKS